MNGIFDACLRQWRLVPDGAPIVTHSSRLLPVRRDGAPAMLKVALHDEERSGAELMQWWGGDGAARVLARDGDSLLLERAEGFESLLEMARTGRDDHASRILCAVASRLHAPRTHAKPRLVPLAAWFGALEPAAARHGGIFERAAATARGLLAAPREQVALHGDIHHGNVLDFGRRGWLAIDPKGLEGERGFDFANILRNPDAAIAGRRDRFARQTDVIAAAAQLERRRLVEWVLALAGLSAAWTLDDGLEPDFDLSLAEIAVADLSST